MNAKELLQELKPLANQRELIIEKIKGHDLPVILYGAAVTAKRIANELKVHNVQVSGFAVDEPYYKEGMTYCGLPVFNFTKLLIKPKQQVFVIGIEILNSNKIYELLKNKDLLVYSLNINCEPMSYSYIAENIDKFFETFNIFKDDVSKASFLAYLKIKIAGNIIFNEDVYMPNQYFNSITTGFANITGGGYLSTVEPIKVIQ